MKAIKINLFILIALLISSRVFSQEALVIKGDLTTDNRIHTVDEMKWAWNENRLDLVLEKKIEGKAKFYGDIWLRSFGFKPNGNYYEIPEIREANVEIYDLFTKGLDLKVGRQIIKWGTADKINPTDNINPKDMEDIWDFGRSLGTEAINLKYYIDDFKAEAIYLPYFRQARLPLGQWRDLFIGAPNTATSFEIPPIPPVNVPLLGEFQIPIPTHYTVKTNTFSIIEDYPTFEIAKTSSFGMKVSKRFFDFDFSLSYLNTVDGLPIPTKAIATLDSLSLTDSTLFVHVDIMTEYPRLNVYGFDVAGAIGSVGVWGEVTMTLPSEKYTLETELPSVNEAIKTALPAFLNIPSFAVDAVLATLNVPNPQIPDSIVLDNEPYFKYIVGSDYTFGNGMYLNFQYCHGFLHERGNNELNDYFFLRLDKSFLDEKLKLAPITGGFAVNDWADLGNNFSIIYTPEVSYKPTDNAEITLGYRFIYGKGTGMFAKLNDMDEAFFKIKYSF